MGEYTYGLSLLLFFFPDSGQGINPMKYRMLIKMDSEAFVAASLPWVDLIIIHHKASDTLRLALSKSSIEIGKNIKRIMPQSQLTIVKGFRMF